MNDIIQNLKLVMGLEGAEKASAQVGGFQQSINNLAKNVTLAIGTFVALRKAAQLAINSMQLYETQIKAVRQLNATLTSTGQAANNSSQELQNLASSLQQVSNFGDEQIMKESTTSLLRFDGISKEMFPRVQRMAVDMGEAMGGLENASRTLGISLADPTLGITRLRRAGVMFTESQEETIKALVATGDKAAAQEILLSGLEQKFKGLAMASISATQQMKNAWGDYLELAQGTISVTDGIKKGITMALYDITSNIDIASKAAQKQALLVQEKWGIATIYVANIGKALITSVGGLVMGITNLLDSSFSGVINIAILLPNVIGKAIQKALVWVLKHDPFAFLVNSFNSLVKSITGKDMKLKIDHTPLINSIEESIKKSDRAISYAKEGFKEIGNIWKNWWNNFASIPSNTKEAIARQVAQLHELIGKQISGLDVIMPDLTGLNDDDLDKLGNAVKKALDDKLKAYANYYEKVDKYGQQWYDSQLALYKNEIDTAYSTLLTKEQLEALYLAKAKDLTDEQFKHFKDIEDKKQAELKASLDKQIADHKTFMEKWKAAMDTQRDMELSFTRDRQRWIDLRIEKLNDEVEAHRTAGVNAIIIERWKAEQMKQIMKEIPDSLQNMADVSANIAERMKTGGLNILQDSIYNVISGTMNMKATWENAWNAMKDLTFRLIAQMITKMLELYLMQRMLGVGVNVNSGGGMSMPAGGFDIPSATIASVGSGSRPSGIGMGYGDTTNRQLIAAINNLRNEISRDKEQSFNFYMDGVPMRNAIRRTENRMNIMGAGGNV